jgi:hypothetical protein
VLRTAAESDLRLRATNAPSATITNSASVFLQIGKPNNALVKLASPLFGTSVAMVKRFLASRRSGFYFAVKKEGFAQTGDSIELLSRDPSRVSVTDIVRVYAFEREDRETIRRAMSVEALPENWREYFQQQLEKQSG